MKTLRRSFYLVLFTLLLIPAASHALTIEIDPGLIDPDQTSTFDITINDVTDMGGFEFSLFYDPEVLTIEDITAGNFLADTGLRLLPLGPDINNSLGRVSFGIVALETAPGTGASGNGTLATVGFSSESNGESLLSFDPDRSYIVDMSANALGEAEWAEATVSPTFTITASSGSGGSISPSGAVTVKSGGSQTFSITPDSCYLIEDVEVDGESQGAISTYTFSDVSEDHTIHVTFTQKPPYVITASAGEGGNISPEGEVEVACGGSKKFIITPQNDTENNACYHIANVLVDGVPQEAISEHTFENVTRNHTISASFALNSYTITSETQGNGTITPPETVTLSCEKSQTFTITPAATHSISDVLVDGESQGPVDTYTFLTDTMSQGAHTIRAIFADPDFHTITVTVGDGGTLSPSGDESGKVKVSSGEDQTFEIMPSECHQVKDIIVDDISVGNKISSYTFPNITADHTLKVSFEKIPYVIELDPGEGGNISLLPETVECGSSLSFEVTPDACYEIKDVRVDGTSVGAVSSYEFPNPIKETHKIEAVFEKISHTITVTAEGHGSIRPADEKELQDGKIAVVCGESQTFEFVPETDYEVAEVRVNGQTIANPGAEHTFENVTADNRILVVFSPHVISATAGEHGKIEPSGEVKVGRNTTKVFALIPDSHYYQLADVMVDGHSVIAFVQTDEGSGQQIYEFEGVEKDHAIEVTFECKADNGGDINGDAKTDLADAILGLQLFCEKKIENEINPCADVNSDEKIGLEEVVYILGIITADQKNE